MIAALLRPELGFAADLQLAIHPSDEMFHYLVEIHDGDWDRALAAYFDSGRRAFTMTRQIVDWRFGGFAGLEMLDFASGYGRVTRHILGEIPREKLTVADVMASAMDYQSRTFGVRAVVSSVTPEQLDLDGVFHVVQAVSLFSHLPEKLFRRWLVRLWSHVRPGGVLILSVHDASIRPGGGGSDRIVYARGSENRTLDTATYGSTWVSEAFVTDAIASELGRYPVRRLPRGLCGYQDVYVIVRDEDADVANLDYDGGVEAYVDVAECDAASRLSCAGWAASITRDRRVEGIDLIVNGEVLATAETFHPRPDVAAHLSDDRLLMTGWWLRAELPAPVSYSQDVAMLVARTASSRTILSMGCVYSLLADAARANLKVLASG